MKWNELSPRKRDALIAEKIFGYEVFLIASEMYMNADGLMTDLPHYTTDIAAAWQVVEHMKAPDTEPGWEDNHSLFADFCGAFRCGSSVFDVMWQLTPETICLAALRTVGIEIEE